MFLTNIITVLTKCDFMLIEDLKMKYATIPFATNTRNHKRNILKNTKKLDINKYLSSYIAGITKNVVKEYSRKINLNFDISDCVNQTRSRFNAPYIIVSEERNMDMKEEQ